jgi:hypothetical protein
MPGAPIAVDELQQAAVAPDQEMRRDTQAAQRFEVRMGPWVQPAQEQVVDVGTAVLAGWQADRVQDHQVDAACLAGLGPW